MHQKAMKRMGEAFIHFQRNGRWGCCEECPQDNWGACYPEDCENTKRPDHYLNIDDLVKRYKSSRVII